MAYALYRNTIHATASDTGVAPSYIPESEFGRIARDNNSATYLVNGTAESKPATRPETFKVLSRSIPNIYNITAAKDIKGFEKQALSAGRHVETSWHIILTKKDDADSAAPVYALPLSFKLFVDTSVDDLITEQVLKDCFNDFLGTLVSHSSQTGGTIFTDLCLGLIDYD